ncbi:MAG: basic secretory protein-like protein [Anaerohalosphaeraceae bacterium]
MKNWVCSVILVLTLAGWTYAKVTVTLDVEEIKDDAKLVAWANQAKELVEQWHPRAVNLIPTKDFESPSEIKLVFRKGDKGIAWTSGTQITVMSDWIDKHPDDIGLVFHEMIHVIQQYKRGVPGWVVEGIADYLRWALYEGKPQNWFPLSNKANGYRDSYQVTGGFFLWLETERCPGIVNKLNTAARKGEYKDSIFTDETSASLESLWADYMADRKTAKEKSPSTENK